jgi:hypothetical protein
MLLLVQAVQRPHLEGERLQALAPLAGGSIQDRLLLGLVITDLLRGVDKLTSFGRVQRAETRPDKAIHFKHLRSVAPLAAAAAKVQQHVDAMQAAARHVARMCLQERWWQLQRAEREFQEAAVQLAAAAVAAAVQRCSSAPAQTRQRTTAGGAASVFSTAQAIQQGHGAAACRQQLSSAVDALALAMGAWEELQALLTVCLHIV